jgi:hypothetical protein
VLDRLIERLLGGVPAAERRGRMIEYAVVIGSHRGRHHGHANTGAGAPGRSLPDARFKRLGTFKQRRDRDPRGIPVPALTTAGCEYQAAVSLLVFSPVSSAPRMWLAAFCACPAA